MSVFKFTETTEVSTVYNIKSGFCHIAYNAMYGGGKLTLLLTCG